MILLHSRIQSSNCIVDSLNNNADSIKSSVFFSHLKEFANDSALKDWDYVAIFIAIFALIIAILTLKSQRKTQENTKYLIKPSNIRRMILPSLFTQIINLELLIFYIKVLNDNNEVGKVRYNVSLLNKRKFEIPNLSTLCEDDLSFRYFYFLNESIKSFNLINDNLKGSIENYNVNNHQISELIDDLRRCLDRVLNFWIIIYRYSILKRNNYKSRYRYMLRKVRTYDYGDLTDQDKYKVNNLLNSFIEMHLSYFSIESGVFKSDFDYDDLEEKYKIPYHFCLTDSYEWFNEELLNGENTVDKKIITNKRINLDRSLIATAVHRYDSQLTYGIPRKVKNLNRKKHIRIRNYSKPI